MDQTFVFPFITFLHTLSGEFVSVLTFILAISCILISLRAFGLPGLYAYNILATLIANIQVLKITDFVFSPEPVALGTVIFATVFLVSDIITEHYGKKAAQKGVWLSFTMQIFMTLFMILTLGHQPLPGDGAHQALETLFTPSPRLLLSSLTAFVFSQILDIHIFHRLQLLTKGKKLWLRLNLSCGVAALLDNVLFSFLAWMVLAPHPVSWNRLIFTYILGTYIARLIVSLISTPIIYLSYRFLPKND